METVENISLKGPMTEAAVGSHLADEAYFLSE